MTKQNATKKQQQNIAATWIQTHDFPPSSGLWEGQLDLCVQDIRDIKRQDI